LVLAAHPGTERLDVFGTGAAAAADDAGAGGVPVSGQCGKVGSGIDNKMVPFLPRVFELKAYVVRSPYMANILVIKWFYGYHYGQISVLSLNNK
jgi:hypothetical protein